VENEVLELNKKMLEEVDLNIRFLGDKFNSKMPINPSARLKLTKEISSAQLLRRRILKEIATLSKENQ